MATVPSFRRRFRVVAIALVLASLALPSIATAAPAGLPSPGPDPRCWAYEAAAAECAWAWGLWDPYTDGTGIDTVDRLPLAQDSFNVCTTLAALLRPFCARFDNPSGTNQHTGVPVTGLQYRLPRVRASEVLNHTVMLTTTGSWGGDIALGEYRFLTAGNNEWTPLVVSDPPSSQAATVPYRVWLDANCYLNRTLAVGDTSCGP